MKVPFHKQTNPNKQAGQVVFSPVAPNTQQELTLSDYIERKTDEPKRITFDEWMQSRFSMGFENFEGNLTYWDLEQTWNAALTKGKI